MAPGRTIREAGPVMSVRRTPFRYSNPPKETSNMSIIKRAAGLGGLVALIVAVGPVSGASATTLPTPIAIPAPAPVTLSGPVGGAYQAGIDAAVGGWNAGADAALGGFNAGASALGLPFSFTEQTVGPLGLHTAAVTPVSPLLPTP
jgi:hypothetical protein